MLVRVTMLEKFRRFLNETSNYDTEQSVKDAITGVFVGNNKTNIGSNFHSICENYNKPVVTEYFNQTQIDLAVNYAKNLGAHFSEIRLSKDYQIGNQIVTVSGATDKLHGNIIRDVKTKFSPATYLDYFESFQWRIYLDIFELDCFAYDVFEITGYKDKMGLDVRNCGIIQHEPMIMYRYEVMQSDIKELIAEFLEWLRISKMNIYFK